MVLTPSNMPELGFTAPDFELLNTHTGEMASLQALKSDHHATVIMFICNHCPYVKHIQTELVKLANDYQPKGVAFIAISANDVENYPEDAPDKMKAMGYPFAYLYDKTQAIAKAYQAACTPDFYIFDRDLKCVYRGQLDESRPENGKPLTGKDMRQALDAILAGNTPSEAQIPSVGCNIKWKTEG